MTTRFGHFRSELEQGKIPEDLTQEVILELFTILEDYRNATAAVKPNMELLTNAANRFSNFDKAKH